MLNDPAVRQGVLASLIAAIVMGVVINPLLRFSAYVVTTIGPYVLQSTVDAMYQEAALGQRDHVSVVILMLILGIPSVLGPGALVILFARDRIRRAGAKPKVFRGMMIALVVSTVVASVLNLLLLTSVFMDLQLNTSFQQRVTVLAPVVSDQEVKELRAMWAQMRSKRDYLSVNTRLDALAKKGGVVLPKPLL